MTIYIFGNPDLPFDSLPFKILPQLKKHFPNVDFIVQDPNEEWDIPDELIIIDTVFGINKAQIITDLDRFESSPRTTLHDFDALTYLKYLKLLGKLKKIKILALPPKLKNSKAIQAITKLIN